MNERWKKLNFDPVNEVHWLRNFSGELRRGQLETEMSTALVELFLSQSSHNYLWNDIEIVDKKTGIAAGSIVEKSDFEKQKLKEVEEKLSAGSKLVVDVRPSKPELEYMDNLVDFWQRGEEDKLTLLRFKVDMSQEKLEGFQKMNKEGYKLADLIKLLVLAKESEGMSIDMIEKAARNLTREFEMEFGEKVYLDAEVITRLFVSIKLEVERQSTETGIKVRNYVVLPSRVKEYLYGQLKVKVVRGGSCAGGTLSGEFTSQGIIVYKDGDGIKFRVGSTEGLTYCPQCGCWYSGSGCPICKK